MPVVQWMILVLGLSTITPDLGQYSAEFAVGNNGVDGLAGGGSVRNLVRPRNLVKGLRLLGF